jgi:histidyl-tRNA synthetase
MSNQVERPKGTKDILPTDATRWQLVEAVAREVFRTYRYAEIRTPYFELTDLFVRGIGDATDIVGKEMFSFETKNEDPSQRQSLTLRPEGTAGVVRAYVEHKLYAQPSPQKLWYAGAMFRYEKPQKGRQRQFTQIGVECLASEDPRWDAEVMLVAIDFFGRLQVPTLEVQLNSVGDETCRPVYREALVTYLRQNLEALCLNCQSRAEKNPMRVLDCKSANCRPVIDAAPTITSYLCEGCLTHLNAVEDYLRVANVPFQRNQRLVRGLDYYTRTVFEVVSLGGLGAQNTVCGGGRYNGLVEELGGPPTPAVGWGLGIERLLLLLPNEAHSPVGIFGMVMATPGEPEKQAFKLAHDLRRLGYAVDLSNGGKLDKQFKQAERFGARFAFILGDDEVREGKLTIKDLVKREQQRIEFTPEALEDWLAANQGTAVEAGQVPVGGK